MATEILISALLSTMGSESMAPLRRVLSVDGGVELLTRVISSAVDPSTITMEQIKAEKAKMQDPSDYGW